MIIKDLRCYYCDKRIGYAQCTGRDEECLHDYDPIKRITYGNRLDMIIFCDECKDKGVNPWLKVYA